MLFKDFDLEIQSTFKLFLIITEEQYSFKNICVANSPLSSPTFAGPMLKPKELLRQIGRVLNPP